MLQTVFALGPDLPYPVMPTLPPLTEAQQFKQLQTQLAPMFQLVFPNPQEPRTVVVIPSLSMDPQELKKIMGVHHYEERMLCLLMLLQLPRTNVIYVTSQPIAETVIDYYLHLLPGIPGNHARRRLHVLNCHDGSSIPLSQKILDRPRMVERIRNAIPDLHRAHITCFNTTELERSLALKLNIPLYACDPDLVYLGNKSHGRDVFRRANVDLPDGFEHLRNEQDIVQALAELKQRNPRLRRAVVKLNDGFSGEGNAIFSYEGCPDNGSSRPWIADHLAKNLCFEAKGETWPRFRDKYAEMGGVVEAWLDGHDKRSPSAQCRINPLGIPVAVSTHDQVLGGPNGQIFLGCTFPADPDYRVEIQEAGRRIGEVLAAEGVVGRYGVDFISVKKGDKWEHKAIEINLRKGGTTHPFLMLQFLTNGEYDEATGEFYTSAGPRYYYASDNLAHEAYKGLTPDDLIDISVYNNLHFHGASQQGVVFHLMGALSEFGKIGVVCIGDSPDRSELLYHETVNMLNQAVGVPSRSKRG
jgi:hypothetical protein